MLKQIASNRVLNRLGARELTPEEVQHVAAGSRLDVMAPRFTKMAP